MDELTIDIHLERRFCPACDSFEWHILRQDGTWECLGCRVRALKGSTYTKLEEEKMTAPRTEEERKSFHERIFGKGSTPPSERLGRGQRVNDLLPMPPEEGPPLPRGLGLKWPWKKS